MKKVRTIVFYLFVIMFWTFLSSLSSSSSSQLSLLLSLFQWILFMVDGEFFFDLAVEKIKRGTIKYTYSS